MGNRAVITTSKAADVAESTDLGLYLHWNGGRDSVEAFLTYCKIHGFRSPDFDPYGWAYLAGVITNYFGDGLSVGIDQCCHLDCENWDNGVYIIEGWDIVGRQYFEGAEQSQYDLPGMVQYIDERMPAHMQLGAARISEALAKLGGEANV
jgi:hypothetical protein